MNFESKSTPDQKPEVSPSEQADMSYDIEKEGVINADKIIEAEKSFMNNFSSRTRKMAYILPLLTTLAACTVETDNGSVSNCVTDPETSSTKCRYSPEEYRKMRESGIYSEIPKMRESGIYSEIPRVQERIVKARAERLERLRKDAAIVIRANKLANQMGVNFDSTEYALETEGSLLTPVIINGHPVPWELLTKEERGAIKHIRGVRGADHSEIPEGEIKVKSTPKIPPEGIITSSEIFMNAEDF